MSLEAARRSDMTARKLINEIGVQVSLRTVQQVLQGHQDIEFGLLKSRVKLRAKHVSFRLEWVKKLALCLVLAGVERLLSSFFIGSDMEVSD